jgi:hypothetical protein
MQNDDILSIPNAAGLQTFRLQPGFLTILLDTVMLKRIPRRRIMSPTVRIVDENIVAEVEIAAPPERVYTALTDPAELAAWWSAEDAYRTFDWESDLRVGGKRNCKNEFADFGRQKYRKSITRRMQCEGFDNSWVW